MSEKVSIRQLATGVPGLDAVLGGGLPEFSFNVIAGAPGSGKTTLAHHIMFSLANPDRRALYFSVMGEPPLKMLRYQQQFDFFDMEKVDESVRFVSLAGEVLNGNFNLILQRILREVEADAPALVFVDSFRSVMIATDNQPDAQSALQLFVQQLGMQLSSCEATTFLVGEYSIGESENNPVFTVADGLLWLTQNMHRDSMVRKLEVKKMRGQAQLPGRHTFRITDAGIQAFPRQIVGAGTVSPEPVAGKINERLGLGAPPLDKMLGGGLPRGYSLLVAGPAGSGKTILATSFLREGARRGEAGVIAAFEKSPNEMMSAALADLVHAGQLGVIDTRSLDLDVDATMHQMLEMIERMNARRVVIDSLSGFELALAPAYSENFRDSLYRMVTVLTARGLTVLMTTELEDRYTDLRFSPYGAAFLTDAIIVQRYVELSGELRRVIAVVKVRASPHSRLLHEFEINDEGLVVGEPIQKYVGLLGGRPKRETG
jgi:circadian clock protein KaiC